MPDKLLWGILALVLFTVLFLTQELKMVEGPLFQKGVSYASWQHDSYNTAEAGRSILLLRETNAEWVSLVELVTRLPDALSLPIPTSCLPASGNSATSRRPVALRRHLSMAMPFSEVIAYLSNLRKDNTKRAIPSVIVITFGVNFCVVSISISHLASGNPAVS